MTTYYDEHFNAYSEHDLHRKFYEWIDEIYESVEILTVHFYPSNIIGDPDSPEFIEAFGVWITSEQDNGTLTEAAQLDLTDLMVDWLQDNGPDDVFEVYDIKDMTRYLHDLFMSGVVVVHNGTFGPEIEPVDMTHTEMLVMLLITMKNK